MVKPLPDIPDPFDIVFKNVLRLMESGYLSREEIDALSVKVGIDPEEFWKWATSGRKAAAQKPDSIG